MTPQAMEKLFRRHGEQWPGLRPQQARALIDWAASVALENASAARVQFWGLLDSIHPQADGSVVLHCFNHSTAGVKFPWLAEAVGFGQRVPLRLTASGTILARKTHRTPWHSMDSAFLVFRVAPGRSAAQAVERLEPGMLLTQPGTARLGRRFIVAALPGTRWPDPGPDGTVVVSHWLSRPLDAQITVEPPRDLLHSGGVVSRAPLARLSLKTAIVADPGWVLALHPPGSPRALTYGVVVESPDSAEDFEI